MKIIHCAKKYGEVVVGVLSDRAMIRFNRFPTVDFEQRLQIVRDIPEVDRVIVQHDIMYDQIFEKIHPDYVIHGDNWKSGPTASIRNNVIKLLEKNGGELIEPAYTYNDMVKRLDDKVREKLAMPEFRRKRLKQMIEIRSLVKAIEVHNGLTGLIAEKTVVENEGEFDQFDAMWVSSLCDSTAKGKPDIELVDATSRYQTIDDVMEVTTKPVIFDGDTGGLAEHFVYMVRTLERMGVSAVIIEDKTGLKKTAAN